MSSRGEIETENKQSVDNCLLDRVASVDPRLVSGIHTQIQTVATRHASLCDISVSLITRRAHALLL